MIRMPLAALLPAATFAPAFANPTDWPAFEPAFSNVTDLPVGKSGWACTPATMPDQTIECHDANGAIAKPSAMEMRAVRAQIGLHRLGCAVDRFDGDLDGNPAAINCFNTMFSRPDGPLSYAEIGRLSTIGAQNDPAQIPAEIEYFKLEQTTQFQEGGDETAHVIHPEADKFIHPRGTPSLGGGASSFFHWVDGRDAGSWAAMRWAEPEAFAGRHFTIWEEGEPLFLVEFGPTTGRATDAQGNVTEAAYQTKGGFTCIPDPGTFVGECLGIAVQEPSMLGDPWTMRAALYSAGPQGITQLITFGDLIEGREGWDAALVARGDADARMAAALASGEELDQLPLDRINPAVAYMIENSYAGEFIPDSPFQTSQKIPFLSYHVAYATACPGQFDGPATEWQNIQDRLIEESFDPFNRYRVYETYVADRIPIQSDYYTTFAMGMLNLQSLVLTEASSSKQEGIEYLADFLRKMDENFIVTADGYVQLLERIGCSGPTVDRLERNLAASFARIVAQ